MTIYNGTEIRSKKEEKCTVKDKTCSSCFNAFSTFPMKKKFNVLLDLDNTLVCSLSIPDELKFVPQSYQEQFEYTDMKPYYRIFHRPYLQCFLDFLFATCNVSIFTAADKDYGLFILDNIILKPNTTGIPRKVDYFFYEYHTNLSENYFKSPKDLRLLFDVFKLPGFTKENTVIVDDLDAVIENNKETSIRAPKFELLTEKNEVDYNAVCDNFLLSCICKIQSKKKKI